MGGFFRHKGKRFPVWTLLLLWSLCFVNGMASAEATETGAIAVIYPEIREPYRSVFSRIIEGIRQSSSTRVETYAVAKGDDPVELKKRLKQGQTKVIIALGVRGFKVTLAMNTDIPAITGAVLTPPGPHPSGASGISLIPDPNHLFARLKSLQPKIQRITVVYNPDRNASLIRVAHKAAKAWGLKLNAINADGLRAAAHIYQDIIKTGLSATDAIWLPQDPTTVDDKTVLPLILKQAWNDKFVIISSNPAHVKKGVLFALYPDNLKLGHKLVSLANDALNNRRPKSGFGVLQDTLIAVNLRTAEHLGLNISKRQQREFDLTFPPP